MVYPRKIKVKKNDKHFFLPSIFNIRNYYCNFLKNK